MRTTVIKVSDTYSIEKAVNILQNNGVIAIPTDTVYGIACMVGNNACIKRLYQIKERDQLKAIPVLIGNINQVSQISSNFPISAKTLAKEFWPGALTLVVGKNTHLPEDLTQFDTVGVRMPDHDWLQALLSACGPLATTSANISGQPSLATAKEVLLELGDRIDILIDGGTCKGGVPSTVVDCTKTPVRILREGHISKEFILSTIKGNTQDGL